ncbi:MAG TPA: hypothetical protein GXX19_08975 [Syntrophomonadaceae bacterium]|nr:hypothetical protein [Syntrophomonadaceae bacterium]
MGIYNDLLVTPGWKAVVEWIHDQRRRKCEILATRKFESLAEVTRVQGEITALDTLMNMVTARAKKEDD